MRWIAWTECLAQTQDPPSQIEGGAPETSNANLRATRPTGFKMQLLNGSTLVKGFVPMPGGTAEVWTGSGANYYRHSDWLGSSRLASNFNRTIYYDGAYGPFGEQYANTGTTDLSFTGMNQDISSNVYDFPAREYGIQGRWPSPDPAGLAAAHPTDPQTWNRYAYVRNSPLGLADATGMDPCDGGIVDAVRHAALRLHAAIESSDAGDSSDGTNCGVGGDGGDGSDGGFGGAIDDNCESSDGCIDMSTLGDVPDGPMFDLEQSLVGVPSGVQVIGFDSEYQGPWPIPNPTPGVTAVANLWTEQVVDMFGTPVQGNFQVNEEVQEMEPNNVNPPTTAGPPWPGEVPMPDYIGFSNPSGLVYNTVQQTFNVRYPGGFTYELSTVIVQSAMYLNDSLVWAYPTVIFP